MIYQIFIILKIITVQKVLDFFVRLLYNYKVAKIYMERWLSWSKAHDWKSCNGLNPFRGSNPLLSARKETPFVRLTKGVSFQLNPPFRVGEILLRNVKSSLCSGEIAAAVGGFNFTFCVSKIFHQRRKPLISP